MAENMQYQGPNGMWRNGPGTGKASRMPSPRELQVYDSQMRELGLHDFSNSQNATPEIIFLTLYGSENPPAEQVAGLKRAL